MPSVYRETFKNTAKYSQGTQRSTSTCHQGFYTTTRQKNLTANSSQLWEIALLWDGGEARLTTSLHAQCRKKEARGIKKRVICFSTPGAPTLASSRMQSLSCTSVWGDGCPYKFMVGGNWSPYSRCPPNWVFCSLPPCLHQQLPPLPFLSFFLPFTGSSFWDSPIVVTEGAD